MIFKKYRYPNILNRYIMEIEESLFSVEKVMSDLIPPHQTYARHSVSGLFIKFFGGGLVLMIVIGIVMGYFQNRLKNTPHSYEECISQPGSKILEKYPPVCVTAEGVSFTMTTAPQPGTISVSATPLLVTCKRTGCSGELCIDSKKDDVITTCDFKPEYACYQEATCERQKDGQCGFTVSRGLTTCLEKAQSPQ